MSTFRSQLVMAFLGRHTFCREPCATEEIVDLQSDILAEVNGTGGYSRFDSLS